MAGFESATKDPELWVFDYSFTPTSFAGHFAKQISHKITRLPFIAAKLFLEFARHLGGSSIWYGSSIRTGHSFIQTEHV